jgi:hypothetical protein
MRSRRRVDRISVLFLLAGVAATVVTDAYLPRGWYLWLPGLIVAAIVLRLSLGPRFRALAFGIGLLAPIAALAAFLAGFPAFDDWRHRTQFEAAAWRRSEEISDRDWPPRLRMVEDLLRTHDLHGWDHARVLALLGEPDQTHWDGDDQLVYYLGPERGVFRFDGEYLVITLDRDGRVVRYATVRD